MNRNTIVALSVAAVLGTTGGVVLAVSQARDNGGTPTAAASTSPPPSASASPTGSTGQPTKGSNTTSGQKDSTNEPLLWANADELHDGDTVVELGLGGDVEQVVRMDGGWVIAERTSTQSADYTLWWMGATAGAPSKFAQVTGAWDADATGTWITGQGADGKVHAWTPATQADRTWSGDPEGAAYSGFVGDQVLISIDNQADGMGWQQFIWDPATGNYGDPGPESGDGGDGVSAGYPHMTVSPDGSYFTGTVDADDSPDMDGTCLHVESTTVSKTKVRWKSCDWVLYGNQGPFSPDGTRLLAVPSQTDGFGPGAYGVVDASDGPGKLVAQVRMPEWTMLAQWADNDSLHVIRATDGDMTSFAIDRCDFDGKCTEVATSRRMPAVGLTR